MFYTSGKMSFVEQRPVEIVAEELERAVQFAPALGDLAMPLEPKQTYAYLAKDSEQLVMDRYAYDFDVTTIPID
jgi:hypothetical protein